MTEIRLADEIRTLRHHVATHHRGGTAVRRMNLKREDGVAMTEFALIVPIFLLIVAGLLPSGASSSTGSRRTTWRARPRAGPSSTATRTDPADAPAARAQTTRRSSSQSDVEGLHRLPRQDRATVDLGDPVRVQDPEAVQLRPDPRDRARSRSAAPRRCGSSDSRTTAIRSTTQDGPEQTSGPCT